MARHKKHAEHANHERWLVSYADFITLLFAFFVVMFASSQVDTNKLGRFSESFKGALDFNMFSDARTGVMPSDAPGGTMNDEEAKNANAKAKFVKARESIRKDLLAAGGRLGGLKILDEHGELVLRLPETLLFSVGQADIQDSGHEVLKAIAEELRRRPVRVRVEGHTDSTPIHTGRFPSNWELSTARATAVIEFWLDELNFDPKRLAAAGYGQWHPIATNDTAEGRAQNRRVDIIIVAVAPGDDDAFGGADGGDPDEEEESAVGNPSDGGKGGDAAPSDGGAQDATLRDGASAHELEKGKDEKEHKDGKEAVHDKKDNGERPEKAVVASKDKETP